MTRCVFALSLAALACAPALAQAGGGAANNRTLRFSEQHGLPFTRVGAVGNEPTLMRRIDFSFDTRLMGRVDHAYNIMTREVTNGEFLEFARAVAPFIDDLQIVGPSFFAGDGLSVQIVGDSYVFGIAAGRSPHEPIRTSFFAAGVYANWLHNDKGTGIEAFQDGAYDASTFQRLPGQPIPQGQVTRHEDARFWMPSMDEWVKAGYYDPNRYGEGEGGWWEFPNASDEELIPGRPEQGGQTNAGEGDEWPSGQERPHEVGMYPDVQSPWGLLDVSGGATEWTETLLSPNLTDRLAKGTDARYGGDLFADAVEYFGYGSPWQFGGIRLASAVPAPGSAAVVSAFALVIARRRR